MKPQVQIYKSRMQRVLDHIDQHLDSELDLETVSGVAAFSKFHFHRQFTATFGVSVHRYVQLARLKRASHRLASKDDDSITQIAMDAGYDAPDAFARAFRKRLGQSPSSFRTFTANGFPPAARKLATSRSTPGAGLPSCRRRRATRSFWNYSCHSNETGCWTFGFRKAIRADDTARIPRRSRKVKSVLLHDLPPVEIAPGSPSNSQRTAGLRHKHA